MENQDSLPQIPSESLPPVATPQPNFAPQTNTTQQNTPQDKQPPPKFHLLSKGVLVVFLFVLILIVLSTGSIYFYLKQNSAKGPATPNTSQTVSKTEPEGLKVAYISSEGHEEKIMAVDINSGQKITLPVSATQLGNLTWSNTAKKLAFTMCCGEGISGIWTMNADGTNRQKISSDDPYGLQWSPDGSVLSYGIHTGQTYENLEAIKIIDATTGSEIVTFNIFDNGFLYDGHFWTVDSNSLITRVFKGGFGRELIFESWQISKDGQITRTFPGKVVFATGDDQIFYLKDYSDENLYPKQLYSSDLVGGDEKVIFAGEETCSQYKIRDVNWEPINNKLTIYVGRGDAILFPDPKKPVPCNNQRVIIYDLKTKATIETESYSEVTAWSPAGKYLAVTRQIAIPATDFPGLDYKSLYVFDFYSENGQLWKTVPINEYKSYKGRENIVFVY